MFRLVKAHLHYGTKSDAVTGWLLYASFYYVRGQYNTTLKIIDHVLSRCTPDMIMLGTFNYTTDDIKNYKHIIGCSTIHIPDKTLVECDMANDFINPNSVYPFWI
jgi:hypothetical protein